MIKRTIELVQINPGLNIIGQPHVITIYEGVPAVITFTGIGGQVGKYVFALLAGFGTVPPGMAFADNGDGTASISGTATASGDYPITMTLDNNGRAVKKSFILRAPALTLNLVQTAPVYAGVATTPGQLRLVASGGSGTGYNYSLTTYAGGVNAVTGDINVVAFPAPGTYHDTATVTDSAANTVSVPVAVIVLSPMKVSSTPSDDWEFEENVPAFQLIVTGATGAVTWTDVGGNLSGGGTPSLSSGGLITGVPSFGNVVGWNTFTVRATDSGAGGSVDITFRVYIWPTFALSNFESTINVGVTTVLDINFPGGKPPYRNFTVDTDPPYAGAQPVPAGLTWSIDSMTAKLTVFATQPFKSAQLGWHWVDALGYSQAGGIVLHAVQNTILLQNGVDAATLSSSVNFINASVSPDGDITFNHDVIRARLATAAALPAYTYANGTSGVGATLTMTATGVVRVDGLITALNDVVLVQHGASASDNGAYACTTAGAVGVAAVFTRLTSMDESGEFTGALVSVGPDGTANKNTVYQCTAVSPITVGTTAITFQKQSVVDANGGVNGAAYVFSSGSGGTVTQLTSKATGVTLNKVNGQITMINSALAAATSVSFTFTNSTITATSVVIVNISSAASSNSYSVCVDAVAAGSCRIQVRNISAGSLSEALKLNFAVLNSVNA